VNQNPLELAGATQEPSQPEPNVETAREVFPVVFEKDYKDYRPVAEDQPDEGELAPKSSSAPASADTLRSVTGLEDLSDESSETTAQPPAEKDKNPTPSTPIENGTPPSSEANSTGKNEPPAPKGPSTPKPSSRPETT
jgi:hypothetical protein